MVARGAMGKRVDLPTRCKESNHGISTMRFRFGCLFLERVWNALWVHASTGRPPHPVLWGYAVVQQARGVV